MRATTLVFAMFASFLAILHAEDLPKLDEALPLYVNVSTIYPVFDFDGDACLPSAGFSRKGVKNHGLKTSGSVTGMCRSDAFMDLSNTYHRHACGQEGTHTYCGHSFALYFLKDQKSILGGGHRHDWENIIVWTTDGKATHASYVSECGADATTKAIEDLPTEDHGGSKHLKFVYHKEAGWLHCFRPAKKDESAENRYKEFVTPTIASWFTMKGDGISNEDFCTKVSHLDFGDGAVFPHTDDLFLDMINECKPKGYPSLPSFPSVPISSIPVPSFHSMTD